MRHHGKSMNPESDYTVMDTSKGKVAYTTPPPPTQSACRWLEVASGMEQPGTHDILNDHEKVFID